MGEFKDNITVISEDSGTLAVTMKGNDDIFTFEGKYPRDLSSFLLKRGAKAKRTYDVLPLYKKDLVKAIEECPNENYSKGDQGVVKSVSWMEARLRLTGTRWWQSEL